LKWSVSYVYTPRFTEIVPSPITIDETAVARLRRVGVLPCTESER
jgi:hypothetical protein